MLRYGRFSPTLPTFFMRKDNFTFRLDLSPGAEGIWNGFLPKVRNRLRKAQKSGIEVVTGNNERFINDFYKVFSKRMKELSFPVYPKSYIEAIIKNFNKNSRIILALYKGEAIGGMLLISFKNILSFPYAATLTEHNSLCANELIYWEAIRQGADEGFSFFDMGRSQKGGGTYHFKEKWGAAPVQLYYQYLFAEGEKYDKENIFDLEGSPLFNIYSFVWRNLPMPVANLFGRYLIKQLYTA